MFGFLKDKINKIFSAISSRMGSLFSLTSVDEKSLDELQKILTEADFGYSFSRKIIEKLKSKSGLSSGSDLKNELRSILNEALGECKFSSEGSIFLLVGINGTGKTTFCAKLANYYKKQGKKVLLVAADTFRAAAVEQLKMWAQNIGIDIVTSQSQDPAAVVFEGAQKFKAGGYDILIVDTAGRLQTKSNLMAELSKIKKVLSKQLPENNVVTLQTIDSMLGQNSFDQARVFNEATKVDGIVLTKFDGTGKGGIIFKICDEIKVPVAYISYAETIDSFDKFDSEFYLDKILS